MSFPVLSGRNSGLTKQYGIRGLPRLVIIDREGKIAFFGRALTESKMKEKIDSMLRKKTVVSFHAAG
ncbi:hypothetical protein BVY01_05035 [bacterium I07]|nr:hypothetical protein BVY01_05035 [bacterium I07]